MVILCVGPPGGTLRLYGRQDARSHIHRRNEFEFDVAFFL
jgi:hypothetical protein